jgi:hypothetical protein
MISVGSLEYSRQDSSNNKFEKVEGLKYYRKWNTTDLLGKYHVSYIASKFPIPGTAIIEDNQHTALKAADVKRFEDGILNEARKTRNRLKLKNDTAAFNTRVNFAAGVGSQIVESEAIACEMQSLTKPPRPTGDTLKEIQRFYKNIRNKNHNYIGYAMASGFNSINWQEPEFGHSFLHIAVKSGDLPTLEQLLKYRADPEIKNRLGYFPIHYAWAFWRQGLSREERLEQEKKTVDILSLLCSYDANSDKQQSDGNTALHLAAKRGPLKAAIILMGFKAKIDLKNAEGEVPLDIAIRMNKPEFVKLFKLWDMVHHQVVRQLI